MIPAASRARLLPLLSGALLVLCFPPFHLPALPFLALVPLLVLLDSLPAGPAGRRRAAHAGLLTGLVQFGLLLYWMPLALTRHSALAIPAWILTVLVLACFVALFAAGTHYARERGALPLFAAAAVFWTATEWLRGHMGDLSFPWLGLGVSLSGAPILAGAADLGGTTGLGFLLATVNGLMATSVLRWRALRPAAWRPAVAGAAVVALMAAYGAYRAATLELRPAATVALVQPNIPATLKVDRSEGLDSSRTALRNLTEAIEPRSVDLVVWPEVALTVVLRDFELAATRRDVQRMSARAGAPILLGAYEARPPSAGRAQRVPSETEGYRADARRTLMNAALVVRGAGLEPSSYAKRRLVPFVERVPFLDPAWLAGAGVASEYFGTLGRGGAAPLLDAGAARYGVLICYESIFPALARGYRGAGADFLVNITNDAWFEGPSWHRRTAAYWQHEAHLVLRAVEQRVGAARAANTGFSGFVDPLGRTYGRTGLYEARVVRAEVLTTAGSSLFARWGDWVGVGVVLLGGVSLLVGRYRFS